MNKVSLLEMLEKEKYICVRLQSIGNMMQGLDEAVKEGRTEMERHCALVHRLVTEAEENEAELEKIRMAIAQRVDDLFAMAVCGKDVAA